jgi:uroporphyrinogen decarboxylase
VDVRALKKTRLVPLPEMKKQKQLKKMITLRPGNRLSITPVTEAEWKHITKAALKNDTLLRALARQPTDYTPIWLMRQAGRTCPSTTRRAREPAAFSSWRARRSLRRGSAAAARALSRSTRDPVLRHPHHSRRDGPRPSFAEGEGPALPRARCATKRDRASSRAGSVRGAALRARCGARDRAGARRRVPLIGFSGSPFTLACYMVEGCGQRRLAHAEDMLHAVPICCTGFSK